MVCCCGENVSAEIFSFLKNRRFNVKIGRFTTESKPLTKLSGFCSLTVYLPWWEVVGIGPAPPEPAAANAAPTVTAPATIPAIAAVLKPPVAAAPAPLAPAAVPALPDPDPATAASDALPAPPPFAGDWDKALLQKETTRVQTSKQIITIRFTFFICYSSSPSLKRVLLLCMVLVNQNGPSSIFPRDSAV
jgi:hypothetical protein